MAGFDGRYLTISIDTGRRIYNTWSHDHWALDPAPAEPVAFWVAILDSLDTTTTRMPTLGGPLLRWPRSMVWRRGCCGRRGG